MTCKRAFDVVSHVLPRKLKKAEVLCHAVYNACFRSPHYITLLKHNMALMLCDDAIVCSARKHCADKSTWTN